MKALICPILCSLLVGGMAETPAQAATPQKHGKQHRARPTAETGVAVHVSFSPREVQVIREHYAPRYRSLPPGLQKKLRRTGKLPPSWQKKFEPFPERIERQLVELPTGYNRGVIDGHAVIFNPRTQVILDVAVLF